jgi:hypothetical protein
MTRIAADPSVDGIVALHFLKTVTVMSICITMLRVNCSVFGARRLLRRGMRMSLRRRLISRMGIIRGFAGLLLRWGEVGGL